MVQKSLRIIQFEAQVFCVEVVLWQSYDLNLHPLPILITELPLCLCYNSTFQITEELCLGKDSPVLYSSERLFVGNIVHEDKAHGSPIVGCSDGPVALLSCCVLTRKTCLSKLVGEKYKMTPSCPGRILIFFPFLWASKNKFLLTFIISTQQEVRHFGFCAFLQVAHIIRLSRFKRDSANTMS